MSAKVYPGAYSHPNGDDVAVDQYLRVANNSGNVAIAGATDEEEGIAASRCESTDEVCAIEPLVPNCVYQCVAAAAVSANADVFRAAGGKISATDNGDRFGIALDAASGDGSIIRVVYKGAEPPTMT